MPPIMTPDKANHHIFQRSAGNGTAPKDSYFLPAARVAAGVVDRQFQSINESGWLRWAVESLPDGVAILNAQRQIVFANEAFAKSVVLEEGVASFVGLRPGEALNCIHASSLPGGCGTTQFCTVCGAGQAIQQALSGKNDVRECRISRTQQDELEALDLRVTTTPFSFANEPYILFVVHDISDEKRREWLERIFFHDLANTAHIIFSVAELLRMREEGAASKNDLQKLLGTAATRLVDEIEAQKTLLEAEQGRLQVMLEPFLCTEILQAQIDIYCPQAEAKGLRLASFPGAAASKIMTDGRLLGRVLGNLLKNALEACPYGETIKSGFRDEGDFVTFWVHTPVHIPPKVQLQIFQRSFSTKGAGRGLGTYSVKLLCERYLQGRVSFHSTVQDGTEFAVALPQVRQ